MELLQEFGDPRVLLLAEDHIVLKMRTPWPRDVSVPEGLSLADNDGLLLLSSQESLITTAKRSLPLGTRILKALFCGCASFESSRSYASAAIELLRDTQSVCIVHNRDQMHTLIRMFPNARVLALPHDLRMHALDKPSGSCLTPLVERSQLRELSGGIYTNCNGCIFLGGDVIQAIMGTCPKIRRIDSPGVLPFFMGTYGLLTATKRARAENFNHLMICSLLFMSAEGTLHVPLVDDINFAADHFPFVETLQVAVGSLMSFCKLAGFRHLRSLDVTFHQRIAFADVDRSLGWVLTRCQGLEELGLLRCSGVRLCTIAKFSPKLKNLRLVACMGSPEDVPVEAQAFPNLQFVEMRMDIAKTCFDSFFLAARDTLRTARFCDDDCAKFLRYAVRCSDRLPFPCLEDLTLATKESLSALKLEAGDLPDFAKALPALRHLETDIFELRLFVENRYVPRGRVTLSWSGCIYCDVHKPEIEKSNAKRHR
ncbi:hypothetical protein MTO96_004059 [Rhipicephalus appendiculatus]